MIYRLAGIVGIDPDPFTLRELDYMSKARAELEWQQTSSVLSLIANVNRNPMRTGPFKPDDFNPTIERRPLPDVPITVLRDVFVDKKVPVT